MPRCEICGATRKTTHLSQIKIMGKLRDFCNDCSTEVRKIQA